MTTSKTEDSELRKKIGLALYWESRPESWSSSMVDSINAVEALIASQVTTAENRLKEHIQAALNMQETVMREHHGRPDCKNCSLAEVIQEILDSASHRQQKEKYSNCCGANDIYDGNLNNNEGVCADCGEHCEMEGA